MNLSMRGELAAAFKSGSQRAGNVTEAWGADNFYCPNCSSSKLDWLRPGYPASDYICPKCGFLFQLKSKQSPIGNSIADGAYSAMMAAFKSDALPSFYFLHYEICRSRHEEAQINVDCGDTSPLSKRGHVRALQNESNEIWTVRNLLLIPHFAFPPSAIIKRPPLAATARRAGWVGCNFDLRRIPVDARIVVIKEKQITPPADVRAQFQKVKPFEEIPVEKRGWMLDVLNVVRQLGKKEFTNQDIYAFESHFRQLHPENDHIRDKIRQKLQNLIKAGFITRAGRNDYRLK